VKHDDDFEFVGSLSDVTPETDSDDDGFCPSGRKLIPVCCSAGLA
jgi:hypothetical protein